MTTDSTEESSASEFDPQTAKLPIINTKLSKKFEMKTFGAFDVYLLRP